MKRLFTFMLLIPIISISQVQKNDSIFSKIYLLDEVSVTGSRASKDIPMTFSDVDSEELSKRNLGQDLPILLKYLPSVVSYSDAGSGIGYTGIRVRGSDATRVNVTINGIPYNDAESQGTFWVNLPDFTSSIKNIQLQRGVGTSVNGSSAFGASLNIQTDGLYKDRFSEISQSFGSFNSRKRTVKYTTGLINNKFEFSGRHSTIKSDGYIDRASSDLNSYFFQGIYYNEKTLLKLILFGGEEITYQSWYGVDPETLKVNRRYNVAGEIYDENGDFIKFYENQVDDYNQSHFQFHWNQKLSVKWDFSLGLNYTRGYGFYEEYNNNQSFSSLMLEDIEIGNSIINTTNNVTQKWLDNDFYVTTFSFQKESSNNKIIVGGSFSRYIGDHYGNLVWSKFSSNAQPNHRFYHTLGKKSDANIFFKTTFSIKNYLSFFTDLQYRYVKYDLNGTLNGPVDTNVDEKFNFFNPKAGFNLFINESSLAYFSFAVANREPNKTDYDNGSPKSEKLLDFELGYKYSVSNINLNLNFYHMMYKDQLVLTGELDEVGFPIRKNVGDSYRTGVEFESYFKISSNIQWLNNFSFSRNINKEFFFKRDGIIQNLGETEISFSPSIIIGSKLIYKNSENLIFEFLSKYIGDQYLSNIGSELSKLDSYFINDLSVNYLLKPKSFFKEIQISLLINNLFNKLYSSNGYWYNYDDTWSNPGQVKTIEGIGLYPQATINYLLGVRIKM